jgi:hypothetical protein
MAEYGKSVIYLNTGLELRYFLIALVEYERVYDELVWFDVTGETLDGLRGEDGIVSRTSAEAAVNIALAQEFDPQTMVFDTRDALRVGQGGSSSPWWIEVLGRLNPLKAVERAILIARDWRTEIESRQIRNRLALERVRAKQVERMRDEVDLIRDAGQLMRDAGVDAARVQQLIDSACVRILAEPGERGQFLPKRMLSSPQQVFLPQDAATRGVPQAHVVLHVTKVDQTELARLARASGMDWRALPGIWEKGIGQ